jgi:LacI family transcriptional regulator
MSGRWEEAVTLRALAAQLGLSITTVSRALNGYDDVAPATRERIVAAASRLGYAPNISAQRLITGRVQAVGVVLPLPAGRFADPFHFEMMVGLGEVLRTKSLELVISAAEPGQSELAIYQRLVRGRRVDGLVVARTRQDDERIAFLRESRIAFVTHGRWQGPMDFDHLDCDNLLGGRLAAELLIGLGHRRILMINAPRNLNFACERETAFTSLATAAGASLEVLEADDAIEDEGERLMHEVLTRGLSATAVFCATDRLAMGAMLAARSAGRQFGKELSIVGYDDLPFSRYADPPLTTVRQPIREAGRRLAEILLTRITEPDRPPVAEIWQPELVLRASHAPAGHARPGKAA